MNAEMDISKTSRDQQGVRGGGGGQKLLILRRHMDGPFSKLLPLEMFYFKLVYTIEMHCEEITKNVIQF